MTTTPRSAQRPQQARPAAASHPARRPRRRPGRSGSSQGQLWRWVVTAVVALVFGFVGTFAAVSVLAEDLRGPQGAMGVPGPAGRDGADGTDGTDGEDGQRGPRGPQGKAAKAATAPTYDIGTTGCVGQPFRLVTDVRVVDKRVQVDRELVCVTK